MSLLAGARLGPYEVSAPIGEGGMGEVYRARDTRLGRDVAIKILPKSVSDDSDWLRRFELEARAAGALNHPNILVVHDVGAHDQAPYVVTGLFTRWDATGIRIRQSRPAPRSREKPEQFGER